MTDVFRFLGCFCIVWYHSSYYWRLGEYRPYVDVVKWLSLQWAMSFFYVTAARHAIEFIEKHGAARVFSRILELLKVLVFWTLVYVVFRRVDFTPGPLNFNWGHWVGILRQHTTDLPLLSMTDIFSSIRNAGISPAYFLYDVVFITLVLYGMHWVFNRHRVFDRLLLLGILLFFIGVDAKNIMGGGTVIPAQQCLLCLLSAAFYKTFSVSDSAKKVLSAPLFFALVLFVCCILFAGIAMSVDKNPLVLNLTFACSCVFLFLQDRFTFKNKALEKISVYGQKYSAGIFLIHQAVFLVCEPFATAPPSIATYVLLNLTAFFAAWGVTFLIARLPFSEIIMLRKKKV
jgi:hypothetical protein